MSKTYEGLIAHIFEQMAKDDANQSQTLADIYLSADATGRDILDSAFMCLCGWQLKTLIEQLEN
jgi:hypothetical protein